MTWSFKNSRKWLLAITFASPILASALSSCGWQNSIKFATFESYLSNPLIQRLHKSLPISFLYYATNEDIEAKFNKYYDLAIPSTYEMIHLCQQDQLAKIDWKYLNDTYQLIPRLVNQNVSGQDFIDLFSSPAQAIINAINTEFDLQILDYCIPYFLQTLNFAYKGSIINDFNSTGWSWDDLTTAISPKNPNQDRRFNPNFNQNHKIGMIDDARSIYAIAALIASNNQNVNPLQQNQTQSEFENQYEQFFSKFQTAKNSFLLNSDSGAIINDLAAPNGLNAAIAYNGDLLYAAMGAGVYEAYDPSLFHFIKTNKTLLMMDCLVINKNAPNKHHIEDLYDVIYQTCLQGSEANYGQIDQKDDQTNQYISGPMLNFSVINYTSPLKVINDFVLSDQYFNPSQNELLKQIYQIDPSGQEISTIMEKYLNALDKSNMHWAYEKTKSRL